MSTLLSSLPSIVASAKKRVGRGLGSGRGSKSGRGTTRHQSARETIPLHFEGGQVRMVKRYPLLRGKGHNKSILTKTLALNIGSLNVFKDGEEVTIETLHKHGLIRQLGNYQRIKLLGKGTLEKKLTIKILVSQSAKKIVEKAGGNVV